MIDLSKTLEWLKLSPRSLTGVALVSGMFLLLGQRQLAYLGLTSINAQTRPWISIAFLVSSGLLLTHVLSDLVTTARKRWRKRSSLKGLQAMLYKLSPEEKSVLASYILSKTKTLHLDIGSGVAGGLEAAGIIYRATNVGTMSGGFAYNIQPWAWDYLSEHSELLSLEPPPE